jgi:hypothetical protein
MFHGSDFWKYHAILIPRTADWISAAASTVNLFLGTMVESLEGRNQPKRHALGRALPPLPLASFKPI